MTRDLTRLFNPRSLTVIGGGAWNEAIIQQAQKFGFEGDIWPVHPSRETIEGLPTFKGVPDLPTAPDATFVGINRDATIGAVERLRRAGAGGAVCFASGFTEAMAEDDTGADAQVRLLRAAKDMPVLGPNCYGFINALDRAIIWPDQHGMTPVDSGVAILTQSSNIAINLSFQNRALPIAMLVTCGNMAQVSQPDIMRAFLDDPRITAIGLHIEGFTDLKGWEDVANLAHTKGIPLVALKAGRSEAARAATQSHTASLAGDDTAATALLAALGIGRVNTLPELLEALKLAHMCGPLKAARVSSISCSGGEASLAADIGQAHGISFPPLEPDQTTRLRAVLGPKVALANPLDYHTYIWRDAAAMTAAWSAMAIKDIDLVMTIVDIPDAERSDPADWDCAIHAAIATKAQTGANVAFVATLPEGLAPAPASHLMAHGVVPMHGLSETFAAITALTKRLPKTGLCAPAIYPTQLISPEDETKTALGAYHVTLPKGVGQSGNWTDLAYPVAVKATGLAHKTEQNGVILGITSPDAVPDAIARLPKGTRAYVEEMVQNGVAELLVAFTNDPAHGIMLTLGVGGTETELWQDTTHLMLPVTKTEIDTALRKLRIAPLLSGYRGKPAANRTAILQTIIALQDFVLDHADGFVELEVNPLICTPTQAVIVDALWVQSVPETDT